MEFLNKRDQIIQKYGLWQDSALKSFHEKKEPQFENPAIIEAKYNQFKSLESQFSTSSDKLEILTNINKSDTDLGKKAEQFLFELQSEQKEIEGFDLENIEILTQKLQEEKQVLEYNVNAIDNFLNQVAAQEVTFIEQFNATSKYIQDRLKTMTPSEKVTIEKQFFAQEKLLHQMQQHFRDLVLGKQQILHQKNDSKTQELSQIIDKSQRLIRSKEKLLSRFSKNIDRLKEFLEQLSTQPLIPEEENENNVVNKIILITDQPHVIIYEITPPPIIRLNQPVIKVQQDVFVQFRKFQWPLIKMATESGCFSSRANLVQRLTYHYYHPYQQDVNGIGLIHSTGSGKTGTLRIVASTFARAGYDLMFAVPPKLVDNLLDVAVMEQSDFNVQQFTQGRRSKVAVIETIVSKHQNKISFEKIELWISSHENLTFKDMMNPNKYKEGGIADVEILKSNLRIFIFGVLKEMGVRQYPNLNSSLTYKQLTNLSTSDVKVVKDYLYQQYPEKRKKDLLYKVFIGIDEMQNIVSKNTNLNESDINFLALREMLWFSYSLKQADPTYECVHVCGASAQPIVNHPLDAINFVSLLYKPDPSLGFNDYGNIQKEEDRENNQKKFMQKEFDFKTLKFKREKDIRTFFNGRLSYFNLLGSAEIFAQPFVFDESTGNKIVDDINNPVQYIPVNLSLIQMGLVGKCFSKDPSLLKNVPSDNDGKIIEMKTGGIFKYNSNTKEITIEKLPKGASAGESESKQNSPYAKFLDCLVTNVTFPWLKESTAYKSKAKILSMTLDETKKFVSDGTLYKEYSPLIATMLDVVKKNYSKAQLSLEKYYAQQDNLEDSGRIKRRDSSKDFENYKQALFVDSTKATSTDIIRKFLESQGWLVINEGDVLDISRGKPYKNVIILDKKVTKDKPLVDFFNNKDNKDGKNCFLIVLNSSRKEGTNLQEVQFITILGFLANDADLKQAVARAVRNCSRKLSPFIQGHGKTIYVTILSPSFPSKDNNPIYPLQILEMLKPEKQAIEIAKKEMFRLLKESAYDRNLLETINQASEQNESAFKLFKTR